MSKGWIQTFTGVRFDPVRPTPDMVRIEDVAHALSNMCRFTGHVRKFYSVAEHSVRVARVVAEAREVTELVGPERRRLTRAALLHDASEAYLVDVPRPIKPLLGGYKELEHHVQDTIGLRFGLSMTDFEDPIVKAADLVLLATEKRDLLGPPPDAWGHLLEPLPNVILPWEPYFAEQHFLSLYKELFS